MDKIKIIKELKELLIKHFPNEIDKVILIDMTFLLNIV